VIGVGVLGMRVDVPKLVRMPDASGALAVFGFVGEGVNVEVVTGVGSVDGLPMIIAPCEFDCCLCQFPELTFAELLERLGIHSCRPEAGEVATLAFGQVFRFALWFFFAILRISPDGSNLRFGLWRRHLSE